MDLGRGYGKPDTSGIYRPNFFSGAILQLPLVKTIHIQEILNLKRAALYAMTTQYSLIPSTDSPCSFGQSLIARIETPIAKAETARQNIACSNEIKSANTPSNHGVKTPPANPTP